MMSSRSRRRGGNAFGRDWFLMTQVNHAGGNLFNRRIHRVHEWARTQADHENKDDERGQPKHFMPTQRVDLNALVTVMPVIIMPVGGVRVCFVAMLMTGFRMVFGMAVVLAVTVARLAKGAE